MMKFTTLCINLYWKPRYIYCLLKSKKSALLSKHLNVGPSKHFLALTLCTTRFAGFHTTSFTNAKSHQERENEYAHGVMENIETYKDSLVKFQSTDKRLPLSSNSPKELSEFEETSDNGDQSESDSKHLVFTYGTLKKGEPNHNIITDSEGEGTFVGMARTVQKWPLIIASRYNIPYLLYCEGVGKHVIGELYQVDEIMLSYMDELESHPQYYTRVKMEVQVLWDSSNVQSSTLRIEKPWIYFLKNFRPHLLDLPHLEDYTSTGLHGLEYVRSEKTSNPEDVYS